MGGDEHSSDKRDVFISYGRADAGWVRTLAGNLHQTGIEVFFDEWDIGPGDILVHRLDAGLLVSRSGILVVSPIALTRPYVQAEYAALMGRAIDHGQLLIPVLLKDAEMPPLLASRTWVDFRNADGLDYLTRLNELVRALKGERPGPPPRTGNLSLPSGTGFKAAGPQSCRLSIALDRCTFTGDGVDVTGAPPRPDFDFDDLCWRLQRARAHWGPRRDVGGAAGALRELDGALAAIGDQMATALLPPAVATALAGAVAEAVRLNSALRLGLEIAEPFADLPWETLRLPQTGVLALHPHVEMFRRIDTGGAAPVVAIPGPLRILVAIGSPEAQDARGELLDMEAELQRILDATDAPRRAGKAFVHILEEGSVAAIHAALATRRYHVLHVSCHAAPGALILETASGGEDVVTAQRFCDEAIPAERAVPLVVLGGCSTAEDVAPSDESNAARLPGLARTLIKRGAPAIIAMQAPVGDRYATELMGCVYGALTNWQEPRPLAALSYARRDLEKRRQDETLALSPPPPPEWATPAFFCAALPLGLYDSKEPFEDIREAPPPAFDPGVVVRRIGDMVGRRREQRLIRHALAAADGAGVLIHGIGGVGKSTLAAQTLHCLATDHDFLLVSVTGETDPDRVFEALGRRLFGLSIASGGDERDPLRQLSGVLRDPKHPWRDRFDFLSHALLAQRPLTFLFDNFEDNLQNGAVADEDLAPLLAHWLKAPGRSRLVFTSRHPFMLPDEAHNRLAAFHLGPLSWAETRKLFWRLDGLKALSLQDQRRAYEDVGGHPRTLEYLDALLRGGKAAFYDVTRRLKQQLKAKGISDPARWCADTIGGLDAALAEAVTLAADDVLLDQLLVQLADDPLACRLLLGAAVYRKPVNVVGLIWTVGEPVEHAPDPERTARLQAVEDRLAEAWKENPAATPDEIFSKSEVDQYWQDFAEEHRPPVAMPAGFAAAQQRLMDLSLLAPVRFADAEEEMFLVHRWTAGDLAKRAAADEQAAAHRAAAAYWRWQAATRPQSGEQDLANFLEARYHLHTLGEGKEAYAVSSQVILQLETWGAWEWEDRLLRETLGWMPGDSQEAAICFQQLGIVAQRRGDDDAALKWYSKALAILKQLGDRGGIARSYHHLGRVAQLRSNYGAALNWYRKALAILKQLGDRAGIAGSYHQLGRVAQNRGKLAAAEAWYQKSLAIERQLGNRGGMADSYHQLGRVAQLRGEDAAAEAWYQKSLAIERQLGDRGGIARSYHQLGRVAQNRGEYDAGLDWYRKSLAIKEQLGDRDGIARSFRQIGVLYTQTGKAADTVLLNLRSLALHFEMRSSDVHTDLHWLLRQRQMLGKDAFQTIVAEHLDAESMWNVLALLDDLERQQVTATN